MYDRDALLIRTQGTAWRLGLAACLTCALPSLAALLSTVYSVGVAIYYFLLIAFAMLTLFSVFASESFRNLFSVVSADGLETVREAIVQAITPYIPYIATAGLILCAAAILIGARMRGVSRAKSGMNAAIAVAVLTVVAIVLAYTFAAQVGAGGGV